MDADREPCVVVGIDASTGAARALEWAAEDAERRGDRLLVSHALSLTPFRLPDAYRGDIAAASREEARKLLTDAQARIAERHPKLTVTTELLDDEPVEGLLRLAQDAEVLVTGSRGMNAFASVMLGSVSHALVAHAPVPVVVVREQPGAGGPVVLGIAQDEAPGPVDFAFGEARRRGTNVLAVRRWVYPQSFPGHIAVSPEEEQRENAQAAAEVEECLAAARQAYPDVAVRVETGLGVPEEALVEASRSASLVVVGSRRHRRRFTLPVGLVTGRVLHHAQCPVAVVPV
jgi:nucleotide-binding universal stress UspA family protein